MLETKVMVAPNSLMLRAKPRMAPVNIPGAINGTVMVRKTRSLPAPSVRAALPVEGEGDPQGIVEPATDRTPSPEQHEQPISHHHRRQHQRQMDDPIEQNLAGELAARQQPGDGEAERQARRHADESDAQ